MLNLKELDDLFEPTKSRKKKKDKSTNDGVLDLDSLDIFDTDEEEEEEVATTQRSPAPPIEPEEDGSYLDLGVATARSALRAGVEGTKQAALRDTAHELEKSTEAPSVVDYLPTNLLTGGALGVAAQGVRSQIASALGLDKTAQSAAGSLRTTADRALLAAEPKLRAAEDARKAEIDKLGGGAWPRGVSDAIMSATSYAPIGVAVIGSLATRNPATLRKAIATAATLPMGQAYVNAVLEAKRAGMGDDDALAYARAQAGVELATEALTPAGLTKTVLGTAAKRLGLEVLSEQAAAAGGTALDLAAKDLKGGAKLAPKDWSEAGERQLSAIIPTLLGAGPLVGAGALAGQKLEPPKETKPTKELPKTGDPSTDAGLRVVEALNQRADIENVALDPKAPLKTTFGQARFEPQYFSQPETAVSVGEIQSEDAERRARIEAIDQTVAAATTTADEARATREALEQPTPILTSKQREDLRKRGVPRQDTLVPHSNEDVITKAYLDELAAEDTLQVTKQQADATRAYPPMPGFEGALATDNMAGPAAVAEVTNKPKFKYTNITPQIFKGELPQRQSSIKARTPKRRGNILNATIEQGVKRPYDTAGTQTVSPVIYQPTAPSVPTSGVYGQAATKKAASQPINPRTSIADKIAKEKQSLLSDTSLEDLVAGKEVKDEQIIEASTASVKAALAGDPKATDDIITELSKQDSPDDAPDVVRKRAVLRANAFRQFKNVGDYLRTVARSNVNPDYKLLAERILGANNLDGVSFEVVEPEDIVRELKAAKERGEQVSEAVDVIAKGQALGVYSNRTNRILIRGGKWAQPGTANHNIAMHEAVHAATVMKMVNPDLLTKTGREGVEEINNIRLVLRSEAKTNPLLKELNPKFLRTITTDSTELVTYALTDPETRRLLGKITASGDHQSLFQRIVRAIKKIVGVDAKNTLLDQILDSSLKIIDVPSVQGDPTKGNKASTAKAETKKAEVVDSTIKEQTALDSDLTRLKPTEEYYKGSNPLKLLVMKLFSFSQGRPQQVNTAIEQRREWVAGEMMKAQIIMNQLADELSTRKLLSSELMVTDKASGKLVLNQDLLNKPENRGIKIRLTHLQRMIRGLELEIAAEINTSQIEITPQLENVLNKILEPKEYLTRTYQAFAPNKYGRKYAEAKWAAFEKNRDTPLEKLNSFERQAVQEVASFQEWFYQNHLTFARAPADMSLTELREKFEVWKNEPAGSRTKDDLVQALTPIFNQITTVNVDWRGKLDQLTKEALNLQETTSQLLRNFRPQSIMNRTVLTPLSAVPEPVRRLWGENTDALVNYHQTLIRQLQLLGSVKTLNQLYDAGIGKWLFSNEQHLDDPKMKDFTVRLDNDSFGPLKGLYTTPFIRDALIEFTSADSLVNDIVPATAAAKTVASKLVQIGLGTLSSASSWVKYASVVLRPMSMVFNFLGSPSVLLMTGNFGFVGAWRGLKSGSQLIRAASRGHLHKDTVELIANGIPDSAQMAEIQAEEKERVLRKLYERELENANSGITHSTIKAMSQFASKSFRGLVSSKATLADTYAYADMWAKLANYFYEKDFVTKYYNAKGQKISAGRIEQIAAERTKLSNYSWNRALVAVKAVEKYGVTAWATYFAETYRMAYANVAMGMGDIVKGREIGGAAGKALVKHGLKRLVGVTVGLSLNRTVLKTGAMLVAASYTLKGDDGEEPVYPEDKEALIRQGIDPRHKYANMIPIKNDNGIRTWFDLSRLDTFDPLTRPIIAFMSNVAKGDVETALKDGLTELGHLFVNNPIYQFLQNRALENKPTVSYTAPRTYNSVANALREFMTPDAADAVIDTVLAALPQTRDVMIGRDKVIKGEMDVWEAIAAANGLKMITFNPKKDIEIRYRMSYAKAQKDAREEMVKYFSTGKKIGAGELEELYTDTLRKEFEAFTDLAPAIEAARLAGASNADIYKQIKDGGGSGDIISALLSNKFSPSTMGDTFLSGVKDRLMKDATTSKEQYAVSQYITDLKVRLTKLRAKYYNYTKEN